MNIKLSIAALLLTLPGLPGLAQTNEPIHIKTDQPVASISPTLWGVFFEDINMGADGGIYAELIKNRSFEFSKPLMGWSILGKKVKEGDIRILNQQEAKPSNPRFMRVQINNSVVGEAGIANEGFRGMGLKKNLRYDFSMMYRQLNEGITIHLELTDASKKILGSTSFKPSSSGKEWHKQQISFNASDSSSTGKLNIWFEGSGTIDLDMISLFPSDTWKARPGGMRNDMIQMLADMKPGFIRFPGGCIVEGVDLANRYQWKKTIGPLEDRQLIINRWNTEFAHRLTPDYFQTFGLGFYEYFQLSEDIGAAPLPILNCGMACQYNTAELVPLDQLDPYIQDALDLIEFANGPASSTWGSKRAEMGHPKPFNLKYLGIGNENWGPQYLERARLFQEAIKSKYPEISLIFSSGTDPDSERFHFLDKALREMNVDIIDEHYYRAPDWFLKNAARYDSFDRKGPKIFAGEYAAHVDGKITGSDRNNWTAAIAEAAFMTGLERNAGVISMASYAPLFANADAWQWAPDMIWVNNLNVYGTPNYYIQKLFSTNKGTHVLETQMNQQALTGAEGLYASTVIDTVKKEIILKIVNTTSKDQLKRIILDGRRKISGKATTITVTGNLPEGNTFDQPKNIAPTAKTITVSAKNLQLNATANSVTAFILKYN